METKHLEINEESTEENSFTEESGDESQDYDEDDGFTAALETSGKRKSKIEHGESEDSGHGKDTNETDDQPPPKKRKKKKKVSTADMKPPTAEEMIRLRETENIFHSNLFRMQIEEMLKEVKPKKIEKQHIKPWLESLTDFFLKLDDSEDSQLQLSDPSVWNEKKSPLPQWPVEARPSCVFQRPEAVSVVGSYCAGCSLGPTLSVDISITIPKKCFLKEDYLNARYFRKRAMYLRRLAKELKKSQLVDKEKGVRWVVSDGNCLGPRLLINPSGKMSKVSVYISAVPQQGTFKLSRLKPDKSNVRQDWLTIGESQDNKTPTPMYNSSVMRDLVMMSNESVRQQILENNNNFKDAVILIRVWLKQRRLDQGVGGFSGYLISMVVVALAQARKLNPLMSSYQIVRNVWLFLNQSDWTKEGATLCSAKLEDTAPSLQDFHRHYDVVFVDSTGFCNLAASVNLLTYLRVKEEARLAVEWLDNPLMNSFQALFMTPMPFLRQFDHVIRIKNNKQVIESVLSKECSESERLNYFASCEVLFARTLTGILRRGLGARVEQLSVLPSSTVEWGVYAKRPVPEHTLVIGIRLNPEAAFSVVEKGPPANEPQAAEFRALWGSRCELRRFKDSSVCEAVVWADPAVPVSKRRLITKQMAMCLLIDRINIPAKDVTYIADQLEPLLCEKTVLPAGFEYGTGEEAGMAAVVAFDSLAKQLRSLPELPLDIAGVQGISAVCRGAAVFPPLARTGRPHARAGMEAKTCWVLTPALGKAPEFVEPIEGLIQLVLSRKWPEEPDAVRRIRTAFNLHIAKALSQQFDIQTQVFPDHIDVFKEGFVFRLRITYPREVALLKETVSPDGKVSYRDTPESLELERQTVHLPKLTGALHGLQQQCSGFSTVCRLAKRWLNSQLLDSAHVPDIATELLVAALFLSPQPFVQLAQPQPLFLRFLHLLASHSFHLEPVVINFNNELKREDLLEIESQFRTERASLPAMVIATPFDKSGTVWTKEAPLLPVLVRLKQLAQQSLQLVESNLLASALLSECKVAFRPPLEVYDAVIHLKPLMLPRFIYGVDSVYKEQPYQLKVPQDRKKIPITGFDAAQCYLQELRDSYSDFALFFHDMYGGTTIGVLFKPSALTSVDFKVSHVNCRKLVKEMEKTRLQLNFDSIIEDFYILGTGLVRTINLSPKYSKELKTN